MESAILANLVKLTGWLAAGFLFLNFLTCWVMPRAKKCRDLIYRKNRDTHIFLLLEKKIFD